MRIQFIGILFFLILTYSCSTKHVKHENFFYYNEASGIATLDPAFAKNQSIMWAVHQLYNTLVEVDSQLNIRPSLAKSWEVDSSAKEYTFHLRSDVFFHDSEVFPGRRGRKMIASDVVFSLKRIMDSTTASSGAWIFSEKLKSENVKALNDSTIQIKLERPFPAFLGLLSMQYCSVVAPEAVQFFGKNFRRNPVGTGPFQLAFWEEGQALVLHKNKHYWEKDKEGVSLPYLAGIQVSFFDSKATEFLLFRQNKLSFINDIDAAFKDDLLSKSGSLKKDWIGKLQLNKHAYLNIEYFGILADTTLELVKHSPLKNKWLRQAINYAIPRQELMMYVRNGIGIPAEKGFIPNGLPVDSIPILGYTYQPEKAAKLLRDAGYPGGKGLSKIPMITVPAYADIASYVAKQLELIGIPIQVEVVQKASLLEQTAKSKALFFRGSWIADYPDPENYMSLFYSKNPAPPNYTRYSNKQFDRLYEEVLKETDVSKKKVLYRKMDQLVIDEAVVVPLWYDEVIHFVQNNVTGFYPNALNLLELRHTQVK
jgi:peptide/nickel transport system substrate-binding protein